MSVLSILLSSIFALSLLTFCGTKQTKKVSDESKIAQAAIELAENLKDAYISKDLTTFEKNTAEDGYSFAKLAGKMKNFDSAELSFTPTWVEIEGSTVRLSISWKGKWTVNDKVTEERGLAIFVFEGQPLKLGQIQRANPFAQPE